MKNRKVLVFLAGISAIAGFLSAQTTMQRSVVASGGPNNMSGGSYELKANVITQTAHTIVYDAAHPETLNSQGFLQYFKPLKVTFRAHQMNTGTPDYTPWSGTNYVEVHYLYGGQWHWGYITTSAGLATYVDAVNVGDTNYYYDSTSVFTGPDASVHRWALPKDSTYSGRIATNDTTIDKPFWEQYKPTIPIVYAPPGSVSAGVVNIVQHYRYGQELSSSETGYTEGDTFRVWGDADTALIFPDTTTGGWWTYDLHSWPMDKAPNNTVTYRRPYTAKVLASFMLWRNYRLMGVPVIPRDPLPTGAHCGYAADDYVYGDQDVVLEDDFSDTWCQYGILWRISRYDPDPSIMAYRYYNGPDTSATDDYMFLPFYPGRGYWAIQTWQDSVPIDVYGIVVDSLDTMEMALGRYDGTNAGSKYNMMANPFYDPDSTDTIDVRWAEFRIRNVTQGIDATIQYAAAQGWIYKCCWVYRAGGYDYLSCDPAETSGTNATRLNEWEGFFVRVDGTDSLHLIMQTHRRYSGLLLARSRPPRSNEPDWSVNIWAYSPGTPYRDAHNIIGWASPPKAHTISLAVDEPAKEMLPFDGYPRIYVKDGVEELMRSIATGDFIERDWELVVEGSFWSGKEVELEWLLNNIPDGLGLYLKDAESGRLIDMRSDKGYSFVLDGDRRIMQVMALWEDIAKKDVSDNAVPDRFFLTQGIPNPFNTSIRFDYGIPSGGTGAVTARIVNIAGRQVKGFDVEERSPGYYTLRWDGTDDIGQQLPSGVYFLELSHPDFNARRRVVMIK